MLLRPLNELSLTLQIKAESPLLIKEGRYTETEKDHWSNRKIQDQVGNQQGDQADRRRKEIKAGFPSAIPISRNSLDEIETALMDDRRIDKVDGLRFYLPGSSIRGAWRSYLERWLRGFAPEDPRICDPFEERKENEFYSCSLLLSKRKTLVRAYADSCP